MNCVRRTYAIQAASSPSKWTCGFKIVVLIALQFLPSTESFDKKKADVSMSLFSVIYVW